MADRIKDLYPNMLNILLYKGKGNFANAVSIMDLELGKLLWLLQVSSIHCLEAEDLY